MILTILVVLVVILIVTSLTLLYMKRGSNSTTLYDLSTPVTSAVPNRNLPWNMKTPSSLRFAVYIQSAPKTISTVDCVNIVETTSLKPSCSDYSFTTCTCNASTDCSNCIPDKYLRPLLSLGSFVQLMVSGYVSQSDKPLVSTLLTVKTASGSASHIESISLPAIPLQKWTVVSLLQEGRRMDVYYGTVLVASTYLKYMPVPAYMGDSWMVGGMAGWVGKVGLFSTSLSAKTSEDVAQDVAQIVDTTGMPYSNLDFSFDLSIPSCLFGTCSGLPPIKPPNPFSVYASSVS